MPPPSRISTWQIRMPVWPLLLVASIVSAGAGVQSGSDQGAGSEHTNHDGASKSGEKKATQNSGESSAQAPDVLVQLNGALEGLAAKVSSGVVQILVTGYGPAHEENRSQTALIVRQHAVGSGVIVDADGYIVTNAHVIEGAQRIRVALPIPVGDAAGLVPVGKRQIREARLLGFHKETDLALLKIDDKDLPTLPFVRHERPHVGQLVFAIGSPEGLQNSVTMGVISAVARQPDPSKPMTYIQTDAPINPGNSGGPLVDMKCTVVGIKHFLLFEGRGSQGRGCAMLELSTGGKVAAGRQEFPPTRGGGLPLPQSWGVLVDDVKPDGPAAGAGLQIHDIVLSAAARRVETLPSITAALYLHRLD